MKGPRLVDAMILSLSKMLGEKVNRKELPPESEEEDEPKPVLSSTDEKKAEDVAVSSTAEEMKVDDTAVPSPEEVKVGEPISSPDIKVADNAVSATECEACSREDCGECVYCLDKKKFGGPNSLKQESPRLYCFVVWTRVLSMKSRSFGCLFDTNISYTSLFIFINCDNAHLPEVFKKKMS